MYYFVFVYSAEMGKFHFFVELQAPLLLFTGPNMHGRLSHGALSAFNTSFFANLNWFSSPSPLGRGGCWRGELGLLGSPVFAEETSSLAVRLT